MARPDRKPHPDPGTRALPPGRRPGRRRRTLMDVWFRGRRCWIGSGVWPVRGVVTSNLVTARSSADLKRSPVVVVFHLPFVASDYAQQIFH